MPSPFPGMDPYLEAPDIWPDFHDAFAGEIRGVLNRTLPAPYYARLVMRPEVGIVEDGGQHRRIVPDVAVVRRPSAPGDGGVAVLDAPRTAVSSSEEVTLQSEPLRHAFVEIRDPTRGHQLVTLVEIVSPSKKRPGLDRQTYLQKQQEVLGSDASLIELDFLRAGDRLVTDPLLREWIARQQPAPDYMVFVNRAWQRRTFQVFRIALTEVLPVIHVPLREQQDEVPLDLQYVFNRTYDNGPYQRGAVDYTQPPNPTLAGEAKAWAESLLKRPTRADSP